MDVKDRRFMHWCVCVCSVAMNTREMRTHACDWKFGIVEGSWKRNLSPVYRDPICCEFNGLYKDLQPSVLHTLVWDTKYPGVFQILEIWHFWCVQTSTSHQWEKTLVEAGHSSASHWQRNTRGRVRDAYNKISQEECLKFD